MTRNRSSWLAPALAALLAACGSAAPAATSSAPAAAPASSAAAKPAVSTAASVAAKPAASGAASAAAKPAASAATSAAAKPAASAAAKPAASAGTTVRISYNTPATTDLPFYIAEDQGFFRDAGINVSLVSMQPAGAIAALSNGELDMINSNSSSVEGATKGFPFKIVWDSWSGAAWTIVGKPEITSPDQLKGKLLATNNPGTAPYAYMVAGLKKAGLTIKDVQYVPVSGTAAVYASIIAKKVDGGVLSTPSDGQAEEQGFREILFLGDLLEIPSNGLATTTTYIAQHRPTVVAMIKAMYDAEQWMKAHPDEAQAVISKHLDTSASVAKRTYDRMAPLLTKTGESSAVGIRQDLDLLEEATGTKINTDPAQFADYGPLHEVLGK